MTTSEIASATVPAAAQSTTPELRIALAMRGGVSLAVWMGGGCSEIDALRRAGGDVPGDAFYAELLQAAGYSRAVVDVVAGASAGGLNGVLLGCSVVYGMTFDQRIRNLWLQLGDLGRLARPWRRGTPPSALDGDGAFYTPLLAALRDLVGTDARSEHERLDLSLTGTLFAPQVTRRYQEFGPSLLEPRNRARFRFRHLMTPDGLLSDFGLQPDRDPLLSRDDALSLLAYAARATSSFPGAFEPASIGYHPASDPPPDGPSLPATHAGVYSESRTTQDAAPRRDFVIDGGVLDNIPVAWAVRSIAAAPADISVVRWLVYMQPVPYQPPEPAPPQRPGLQATVKRAQALQSGTESLADDLDELELVRREALRRRGFRQVVEYALGEQADQQDAATFLDDLYERALAGACAYRERAGLAEADRLRQLWTDPLSVLGADLRGFTGLGALADPAIDRAGLVRSLSAADCGELVLAEDDAAQAVAAGELGSSAERRDALLALGRQIRTPQALARTVATLLEVARELGPPGLPIKAALYDVRCRIETRIARHDRCLAAQSPPETASAKGEAIEAARRAAWRSTGEPPDAEGWPDPPYEDLWSALVQHADELMQATTELQPPPPRALVDCLLLAAGIDNYPAKTRQAVLVAVELLTGPLRQDPLAESAGIRFRAVTADAASPHPLLRPGGQALSVNDKLAGNQVRNFGAFLSARWRLNDWTWGRLDAADSLIRIVTQPSTATCDLAALRRLAGLEDDTELPAVVDALICQRQEQILREELPLFDVVGTGPPTDEDLAAAVALHWPPDQPLDVGPLLDVGGERVRRLLLDPGRTRIIAQIAGTYVRARTASARQSGAAWLSVEASQAANAVAARAQEAVGTVAARTQQAVQPIAAPARRGLAFARRALGRLGPADGDSRDAGRSATGELPFRY